MKNLAILLLLVSVFTACSQTPSKTGAGEPVAGSGTEVARDGLFLHISEGYNDPHRVLMPMKMATLMANDKDVLIYMDIHAVNLLVKGAADLTHDGFDSFQTYLNQLLDLDVGIYACPTCLQVAGFQPEDLVDGIQTANKEKFFNFTSGRILTMDY